MDVLTISWGWFGGSPVAGPTPPAPPVVDDGDAAALVSFGDERQPYWRKKRDPWEKLNEWAGETTAAEQARMAADRHRRRREQEEREVRQVTNVTRISRFTRRRR